MSKTIKEYQTFFREFRKTFNTTGALTPSGRFLARAIAGPLSRHSRPVRVLEVGAGTGAVTKEIIRHVRPDDWFDIVELNDRFVELLRKRFQNESDFRQVAQRTAVLHQAIQDLEVTQPYDYIICGVPFNNFPISLVKSILRHLAKHLAPDGTLTFFEYLWIRNFKQLLASREERYRLAGVRRVLGRYLDRYEFQCDTVWINIPPALAHHLRVEPIQNGRSASAPERIFGSGLSGRSETAPPLRAVGGVDAPPHFHLRHAATSDDPSAT